MLVFVLAIVLGFTLVITLIFYFSYENDEQSHLINQAEEAAARLDGLNPDNYIDYLDHQLDTNIRYTLVDPDGSVLFDSSISDVSELENHASRPEIADALEEGEGFVRRYSTTLNEDTIYAAVRLNDGSVIRVSERRASLLSYFGGLNFPVVIGVAVLFVLVYNLSRLVTRRIMRPIDALDFADPLENEIYTEMQPLLERIDEQQNRLKEQNEQLAKAQNIRRDFSANVSHEMKTPLQVISGYSELMKNGMVNEEDMTKFAGIIYSESQTMRSLINDVLLLSKLDESIFSEDDSILPTDMFEVGMRAKSRLSSLAEERQVSVDVKGVHGFVRGNETLLEQMALNLIENAIRYNHEGGHVIYTVSLSSAEKADGTEETSGPVDTQSPSEPENDKYPEVIVSVEDDGSGIPESKRDKIFERFYRLEKSRSKETGGTGLGLAIVKHTVTSHGGTIEVSGEEGHGSTFTVRFPGATEA
ncbi:MAG: ATP-binding protein [Eggerthellaceae bacterium]|nr:ATP-binding protein [Eggerthellaceae bacterium]